MPIRNNYPLILSFLEPANASQLEGSHTLYACMLAVNTNNPFYHYHHF